MLLQKRPPRPDPRSRSPSSTSGLILLPQAASGARPSRRQGPDTAPSGSEHLLHPKKRSLVQKHTAWTTTWSKPGNTALFSTASISRATSPSSELQQDLAFSQSFQARLLNRQWQRLLPLYTPAGGTDRAAPASGLLRSRGRSRPAALPLLGWRRWLTETKRNKLSDAPGAALSSSPEALFSTWTGSPTLPTVETRCGSSIGHRGPPAASRSAPGGSPAPRTQSAGGVLKRYPPATPHSHRGLGPSRRLPPSATAHPAPPVPGPHPAPPPAPL